MSNPFKVADDLKNPAITIDKLMQYANGAAPDVVQPALALAEMARRKREQSAQAMPQANQEMPTVKQQTEQQLGLLALQKQRNAQMQQKMAQMAAGQAAPGAIGPGYAGGGVVGLSNRGNMNDLMKRRLLAAALKSRAQGMAGGGIVAFEDNKDQPVDENMPSTDKRSLRQIVEEYIRAKPGKAKTTEEIMTEQEAMRSRANKARGAAEGPEGAGLESAYRQLQERQNKFYGEQLDPMSQLIEFGKKFASADPTKGWGVQGAEAAGASSKYRRDLQQEQMKADMTIQEGLAKIDSARRKAAEGDVDDARKTYEAGVKQVEEGKYRKATVGENVLGHDATAARANQDRTAQMIIQEADKIRAAQAKKPRSQQLSEEQIVEQARRNVLGAKDKAPAAPAAPAGGKVMKFDAKGNPI